MAVGAMAQETTDLRFLEADGPVKSIRYAYISNVTIDGKMTKESTRSEGVTYFFDRQGKLTGAVYDGKPLQITRDKQGRISRVKMPASRNAEEDNSYAYTVVWNEYDYPQELVYDPYEMTTCKDIYLYGYTKWAEIDRCEVEESEGFESLKTFCILEQEELYTNWTKRLEISIYSEFMDDVQSLYIGMQIRSFEFY